MNYYALSSLLMAFCMQASDNSRRMAPGAFEKYRREGDVSLSRGLVKKVPIKIITHHLLADYPGVVTQQEVDHPALHKPKPVNFKPRKLQTKKDSQYTTRPSRRKAQHNGNQPTRLIYGLVSPEGEEIAFAPGQGVIGVFTLPSNSQTKMRYKRNTQQKN
jgi:hypothetical protein